jgi:hypothetical protein
MKLEKKLKNLKSTKEWWSLSRNMGRIPWHSWSQFECRGKATSMLVPLRDGTLSFTLQSFSEMKNFFILD